MEHILIEKKDGVAYITLNRPDKLNSFTIPMGKEMRSALEEARDDETVRAIHITGAGRAFCAGQDLEEATAEGGPGIGTIVDETYNPIITLITEIEKPVICLVNGVAAGAGANIALACDITYARPDVSFIQSFSNIGLIPDSGGTFTMPRLVGKQRAAALMFSGAKLSAKEAVEMGMIFGLSEEGETEASILMAQTLSKRPTKAIGLTKRLLKLSASQSMTEQLNSEKKLQIEAADSRDHKEGVKAFLEKRKPTYTGK